MEDHLRQFLEILAAASQRIDADYFQLPQAGDDAVYRERVYCYELYHHLRTLWGQFPYSLGGEVDKAGHALFRGGPYAQSKPDLLVHVPGDMGQNLAVVEVKAATATVADLVSDIEKLSWFCGEPANYFCGVLLVYGRDEEFKRSRKAVADVVATLNAEYILLAQHMGVGRPTDIITTTPIADR